MSLQKPRGSFAPDQPAARIPAAVQPPKRVLLAEDDEMLSRFLQRILEGEGYLVDFARDGSEALRKVVSEPDLFLLDLNLPEVDGLGVLRQLRPRFPNLPVLVLTGRDRGQGTLPALDHGADDCLTKPFSYVELLARMRSLLRRASAPPADVSCCSDLTLDRVKALVTRAGRRVDVTQREFSLLERLMRTPGVPVPRAVLLEEVWGAGRESTTNVVDVYMKYVRDKVDLPGMTKLIQTVRGTGYVVSES